MRSAELARLAGTTVRTLRHYHQIGLLDEPRRSAGGYRDYGLEHLVRVLGVRRLVALGLSLEAVAETLDGPRERRDDLLDELATHLDELAAAWGVEKFDPKLLARVEELAILRRLPDGKVEVISPRLQRAGAALIELGVPPQAAVETAEQLRQSSEGVARIFVELFVREIWEPFDKAGRPEEDWPKVREALDRMRPLASDALLAMFQITMGEETEKAAERTLRNAGKPTGRRRSRRRR